MQTIEIIQTLANSARSFSATKTNPRLKKLVYYIVFHILLCHGCTKGGAKGVSPPGFLI